MTDALTHLHEVLTLEAFISSIKEYVPVLAVFVTAGLVFYLVKISLRAITHGRSI